jgi:hypothetical protein
MIPQHTDFGTAENDRLRSRADAAHFLNVSISTLERWDRLQIGPKAIKIGPRRVGYRVGALVECAQGRSSKEVVS